MGWVKIHHQCVKPIPERVKDLWRCDDCGTLWVCQVGWYSYQAEWFEAGRWLRWKYRGKNAVS